MKIVLPLILVLSFSACSMNREYALKGDFSSNYVGFEMGLTPAQSNEKGKASFKIKIEGKLSDGKQIIRLER